ncbi:NAD(P)/FAD-dependent oxidoreductase [Methanoregula sp.]|uniref:dihydrolipoyl dehydrogenase family protein n=1 Tax=Methanoregula sp. TaxID=2052170 RepID=UPI002CC21DC0|nr:NAD(P)/FAD-dependent oxidoreductase [Methanoregula sp.]HVP95614.1 NAD(P)/FAD-dependent oxidoreductase [Methanoregula sp.]
MIVVLGGGPAGRIASIRLASAGKKVTLVEPRGKERGIGGQCLHFGCMPVCALNDVARIAGTTRRFYERGMIDTLPAFRFRTVMDEMLAVQQKIAGILDEETRQAGVNVVYGKAGRVDERQVFIGDEPVDCEAAIIATGSRPNIPSIPGVSLKGVFTPHTLWDLRELPGKIAIIGGSVMAAEFAYIFQEFGSSVVVLARSGFLKNLDPHLRAVAIKELSGVDIQEGTEVKGIAGTDRVTGVRYRRTGEEREIPADAVLLAAGLIPNSGMVTGIGKGTDGAILTNDRMQTSIPGIYACGDVAGAPFLTPVARHEGVVAADNILGKERHMDYSRIPQAIYLAHELAFCGGGGEGIASLALPGPAGPGTYWSVPYGDTGLAKIFAEPATGKIAGICAAGPAGGTIAGYLAFLMQRQVTVHDFEEFLEVHPSTDGIYGIAKYTSEIFRKRNAP